MGQKIFRRLLVIGLPITLGVCAWAGSSWWNSVSAPSELTVSSRANDVEDAKTIQFQIPPGTAAQTIGRNLEAAGLIRSATAWDLWARWLQSQDSKGGFKAGNYQLSPNQPLEAIADTIWRGQVMQRSFTIPEGLSLIHI